MYLIPLHLNYNYICNDYFEKYYLHFNCTIFSGNDIFSNLNSCCKLPIDSSSLNMLLEKISINNLSDIFWYKSFLFNCIAQFIENHIVNLDNQILTGLKYERIFNFIKSNLSYKITLNQLAEKMNISPSNLSINFRIDMNCTIKEYVNSKIIQQCKQKLLLEDRSVKEIAYNLGFNDEFYFSRFFKRQTGLSPKNYKIINKFIK